MQEASTDVTLGGLQESAPKVQPVGSTKGFTGGTDRKEGIMKVCGRYDRGRDYGSRDTGGRRMDISVRSEWRRFMRQARSEKGKAQDWYNTEWDMLRCFEVMQRGGRSSR